MRASIAVGILLLIIAVAFLAMGGYEFYSIFFLQKLTGKENIPVYATNVVFPIFFGFLVLIDAAITLTLLSSWALIPHALANLAFLYATANLVDRLSIPVLEIQPYESIFFFFAGALLLLILGLLVNSLRDRRGGNQKSSQ